MATLDEIAAYLASNAAGTVKTSSAQTGTAWLIYKGGEVPGDRTDAIILSLFTLGDPILQMGSGLTGVVAETVGLQAMVRHESYASADLKAREVWGILHGVGNTTLTGTRYLWIKAQGSVVPIGRDPQGCWMIGANFEVTKELS